jgi:hypothetical protein
MSVPPLPLIVVKVEASSASVADALKAVSRRILNTGIGRA